jgi:translation initiation factor 2 beta subunit (eIF-2beta)/eIF-5
LKGIVSLWIRQAGRKRNQRLKIKKKNNREKIKNIKTEENKGNKEEKKNIFEFFCETLGTLW